MLYIDIHQGHRPRWTCCRCYILIFRKGFVGNEADAIYLYSERASLDLWQMLCIDIQKGLQLEVVSASPNLMPV